MDLFGANAFADESDRVAMSFFNSVYAQGRFLWALKLIASKQGCVVNEDYCLFPDMSDADPSCHFEGVMFGGVGGEVIVSDVRCREYVAIACKRYVAQCPGDLDVVDALLKEYPNKGPEVVNE